MEKIKFERRFWSPFDFFLQLADATHQEEKKKKNPMHKSADRIMSNTVVPTHTLQSS